MSRGKRKARHAPEIVAAHMLAHHPGCPDKIVEEVVRRVSEREWRPPVTLGGAVGRVLSTHVRHRLTDYDRLLRMRQGITREEARIIVAGEVDAILKSWRASGA